jgi:anti-sigma B factor antagonist
VQRPGALYEVERIDDPRGRVVRPRGELGAEATDDLRAAVTAALGDGQVPVVLDLTEVTFMDSTALSIVLGALREAWARGQGLLVAGPLQPTIVSLLGITGVDRFLTVHESREAALAALSG